jgi:hypothetical protein
MQKQMQNLIDPTTTHYLAYYTRRPPLLGIGTLLPATTLTRCHQHSNGLRMVGSHSNGNQWADVI